MMPAQSTFWLLGECFALLQQEATFRVDGSTSSSHGVISKAGNV